jgi:hypothetical protein
MVAELNKASAIEGLGKTQGLVVSIAKTRNYVSLRITFCQSLSRSKGRPNERSPLADGRPCFGCSWEEGTMVRHDARARIKVPCGFQAKQATDKSPLQRFGRIVASVVCYHQQSFLQAVKDHYQRARGPSWHLRLLLCYDPRQFSSLFLSAAKR